MKTCDFSRSFITFVTRDRGNNARIQVEARCTLLDNETNRPEEYYLVASCKGEDTYGKGVLFNEPAYDFCMVYSSTEFMIIRTYANAENDNTTVNHNLTHFLDVRFHISMIEAELLEDNKAIVQATMHNRIINGRVEITHESGRYKAILEFPVKTMNVNDIKNMYQVDTGPIIVPDFSSSKDSKVEKFRLAFVAYNRNDEAYFIIQEPISLDEKNCCKTSHYSNIIRLDSKNSILTL